MTPPAPAAGPAIEPYPDVRHVLDRLQLWGVRMSIVSDTWTGLEAMFAGLGIEHYFHVASFVGSGARCS
jgi:phosphoglycolate phosphatase-like HAD superfamily hydrolase